MRTQPINIYLMEPSKVLEDLTIVIPDESYMSQFQDVMYCNGRFLVLSNDISAMEQNIRNLVANASNVVLTTKDWKHEREFLTRLYDYLEDTDGIDNLYIIPTVAAVQIFDAVATNQVAEPAVANGYVPSNDEEKEEDDLLKIADLFEYNGDYDIPDDEVAASLADYISVDKSGFIVTRGGCVGNIRNATIRYSVPDNTEAGPFIIIRNDPLYIPDSRFREDDNITFSGNYVKASGSMYSNLEDLDLGRFGLCRYKVLDKYYHITDGQGPVFVKSIGNRVELSNSSNLSGQTIDKLTPVLIHTDIGLLFARCAARDKRRVFDLNAWVYYNGLLCPFEWRDNSRGGCLSVGYCLIDDANWKQFMEVLS